MRQKVDWTKYREEFPSRYTKQDSYFDSILTKTILNPSIQRILDVGGGHGTKALKSEKVNIWLLDPNVLAKSWMKGNLDWREVEAFQFDLAVARGSINYLTEQQIKKIPKISKAFLANSFDKPPSIHWQKREYNTQNGDKGQEWFRFKDGKIEHKLIPDNGPEIVHSFFYYSKGQYEEMLPGVKIEEYGNNSILLKLNLN